MDYYELGQELARLSAGQELLEQERTRELLSRYLPPSARIVEIGSGPGAYSLWLAEQGHEVVARDLAPLHIEQLQAAAAERGLDIDSGVADPRDLDLPDASVDAVLVMGPLYYLRERDGRLRCLREAARVVRPGGIVAAAAISRWAILLDGVLLKRVGEGLPGFEDVLDTALSTGMLEPLDPGGFSAFCHRPQQLREEAEAAGLRVRALVSIEGPGAYLHDLAERWQTPAGREAVLDVARRLESVPEMLGIGGHLLLIATRP
jgi:SAM-dependent methyltransferase